MFSLFGYRFLLSSLIDKADRELEARLNNAEYDESQLIAFKVPITSLSYYNPSDKWERVEGSIEIGNVYYKYVKRRIMDDSLEVLCIPNSTATRLQAMKRQGAHPLASKIPAPEPYVFVSRLSLAPCPWKRLSLVFSYSVNIPFQPRATEERPPAFPA